MSELSYPCFLLHFSSLRDPRQSAKVLYPLPEILLLILCGTIAGADDFVEIGLWGSERQDFLRRFLPFEHGIPSHDTLCDVIAALDPELFKACFLAWVDGLRTDTPEVIAIDWQDIVPQSCPQQRPSAIAYGFRLDHRPAVGPWTRGRVGEIQ